METSLQDWSVKKRKEPDPLLRQTNPSDTESGSRPQSDLVGEIEGSASARFVAGPRCRLGSGRLRRSFQTALVALLLNAGSAGGNQCSQGGDFLARES